MLSKRNVLGVLVGSAIAALGCSSAFSLNIDRLPSVNPAGIEAETSTAGSASHAAVNFVNAMATRDVDSLWMFATEEEQDAFQTEKAAFAAYADAFPALTHAKSVKVMRSWAEGDTSFFELRVVAKDGETYRATLGLWRDDAGDWKLVSCGVAPLTERVARR